MFDNLPNFTEEEAEKYIKQFKETLEEALGGIKESELKDIITEIDNCFEKDDPRLKEPLKSKILYVIEMFKEQIDELKKENRDLIDEIEKCNSIIEDYKEDNIDKARERDLYD